MSTASGIYRHETTITATCQACGRTESTTVTCWVHDTWSLRSTFREKLGWGWLRQWNERGWWEDLEVCARCLPADGPRQEVLAL